MNYKELAPICLFTYNRLEETKQTVLALQSNYLASQSELFIFSDGWKNEEGKDKVLKLRLFLKEIYGFKKVRIFESSFNNGLAKSIIGGVTKVLKDYKTVIVLEDDLKTSPNFLDFMNQSLDFYIDNEAVQSISGYSLKIRNKEVNSDVYFHKRAHSWTWATWSDRWDEAIFDKQKIKNELTEDILNSFKETCGEDISEMLINSIEGVNDSWYVRWAYDHFKNEKFAVYPYYSKVENIGFSIEGTNCKGIDVSVCELDTRFKKQFLLTALTLNKKISCEFLNYFSKFYKLKFRLKLLKNKKGRESIFFEIKNKLFNGK